MADWRIRIRVMPFSVEGPEKDLKAAGGTHQSINVNCDHFDHAVARAKVFLAGINTNPRVWRSEIISVEKVSD